MKRGILISLLLFLFLLPLYPQTQGILSRKFFGNWSVGVGGGPNIFFGDLKVYDFWPVSTYENEWRFAGSFYLIKQVSHVFAFRGQALYGEISGTKRFYKNNSPCNQYFEGTIFEYNLNTTINFSNLLFRYKPQRKFFIYGTLGVGLSNWLVKKRDLNTHREIGGSGTASNWTTEVVVPAGAGAYYNIGDKLNLGLEWTLRGVNSDKLDATPGGFKYDMYSFLSFNIVFNFNRRNPVTLKGVEATMPPSKLPRTTTTSELKPSQKETATVKPGYPPPFDQKPYTSQITIPPLKTDSATSQIQISPSQTEVTGEIFRVQIFSSKTGRHTAEYIRSYFKLTQPVYKELSEGYYRYYTGSFTIEAEAHQVAASLRLRQGLQGAFVVKFINGKREPSLK